MHQLKTILDFFNEIGLPFRLEPLTGSQFLPGISIRHGMLIIDPEQLSYPGDLLHEAGHIAVMPAERRHLLNDNVNESAGQGPAEEMAAIAWSWAALQQLKLPSELLFHPDGYLGGSDNYKTAFEQNSGFGHPMLHYYGMCEPVGTANGYPQMKFWLRT